MNRKEYLTYLRQGAPTASDSVSYLGKVLEAPDQTAAMAAFAGLLLHQKDDQARLLIVQRLNNLWGVTTLKYVYRNLHKLDPDAALLILGVCLFFDWRFGDEIQHSLNQLARRQKLSLSLEARTALFRGLHTTDMLLPYADALKFITEPALRAGLLVGFSYLTQPSERPKGLSLQGLESAEEFAESAAPGLLSLLRTLADRVGLLNEQSGA